MNITEEKREILRQVNKLVGESKMHMKSLEIKVGNKHIESISPGGNMSYSLVKFVGDKYYNSLLCELTTKKLMEIHIKLNSVRIMSGIN